MAADSSEQFVLFNHLAEEFAARYRRGERPSLEEYIDRHPQLADDIREFFPALAAMEQVKDDRREVPEPARGPLPPLERLGDFLIIREIGHGGMGVVYEAEQVSLGRHVALKVLPKQLLVDARTKRRFEREAKAAARLHHTNIVPVFGVGEHDGLPYYAMQFIAGLGLDEVLEELRRLQPGTPRGGSTPRLTGGELRVSRKDTSAAAVARSLLTGCFTPATEKAEEAPADRAPPAEPPVAGRLSDSFSLSSSSAVLPGTGRQAGKKQPTYWQSVARIGVQVADALEYAHRQGIQHRDIKPSNLLLDTTGTVWVTDFGLARDDDQQALTHTGDVLGTLHYVPPEAFDGKADARGDIYSLGLTLYELLAFRPAFDEKEHNRLIKQVTTAEPPRLDRLNPQVPRDLVTIVHKAIEREPGRRYPTAEELAADLRRFVEDRPVQARRVSGAERLWRWCRRNPLVAGLTAAVAVLLVAGTTVATSFAIDATLARDRADAKAREAESHARQTLLEKDRADRKAQEADANAAEAFANLYVVRLNSAQMALENGNQPLAQSFLEPLRSSGPGSRGSPGWEWHYHWRLCHHDLRTLLGHTDDIGGLAFSPDATRLASRAKDGTLRLWELATGRQVSVFAIKAPSLTCLAFSPDGTRLAVAAAGHVVSVVDAANGQVLRTLKGHTKIIRGLAFSPDGARLFTVSEDRTLKVWDMESGQERGSFPHPAGYLRCVAVSPDGKWLALGGSEPMLVIRDAASGQEVRTLSGHLGGTRGVAFSPDGRRLASAGKDRVVKVWDTASGQELLTLAGHREELDSVAFNPDGTLLASAGHDQMVKVWDANSGKEVVTFLGHKRWRNHVAFSPDGQWLASGGADEAIKLWNPGLHPGPRILRGHDHQVRAVGFSVDGQRLVSVGLDGKINVWDTVTGHEQPLFPKGPTGHLGMAVSPDSRHLATAGDFGEVTVWDLTTGQNLRTLKGHPSWVGALAFSPDGQWLASGGAGHPANQNEPTVIKLWQTSTGEAVRSFLGHNGEVKALAFTPDGTRLISGSDDRTLKVWDVANGAELRTLRGHTSGVTSIALRRDGNLLASASGDQSVKLWDPATGREVRTLQGHTDTVWSVAFHPSGSRLATSGWDQTVRIWDTASGLELATLKGHPDRVLGVAFSPDGNRLATAGGQDRTVRLWDARPLTPEVKAEVEAVGLLEVLFARPLPKNEVRAAIQRDRSIGEATRRKALELADRFQEETDPEKYHAAAWPVIRHPYANRFMCQFALTQMKAACARAPDHAAYRIGLGVAQYRLGRFQKERYAEALATLTRCDPKQPATLAFLAMAQHQLGREDQVRTTLDRLRDLMKKPPWLTNREGEAFERESAELIEGKNDRPRK